MPIGLNAGAFTVTSDQGGAQGTFTINVWDFALPLAPSAPSMFVVRNDTSCAAMAELLRHRMIPCVLKPELTGYLENSDESEYLKEECGLNMANIGYFSGDDMLVRTMTPAPWTGTRSTDTWLVV